MKTGRGAPSLNLPTLLSFNELAWVAVSAMALFCGYLLSQDSATPTDHLRQQLAALSNEGALLRIAHQEAFNELARAAVRLADATNRLEVARGELEEFKARLAQAAKDAESLSNRLVRAEEERAQLRSRLAQAQTRQGDLEARLARAESEGKFLSNRLVRAEEETSNLRHKLSEAERRQANRGVQLAAATNSNLLLQAQLQQATDRAEELERQLAEARARLAERPGEGNIRKELLSLRGAMSNVVILLDRSSSMADGRRWEDSLRVIEAWLEYLPIENCALVTFSTDCQPLPADGSYLAVGGTNEAARDVRRRLLRQVRALRPEGNTATVEALQRAYQYPALDTIILFTDGEPLDLRKTVDRKRSGPIVRESELTATERRRIAKAQIEEALALARNHPSIPINVVALADYFADWKADFLLGLARSTGGAFLGR